MKIPFSSVASFKHVHAFLDNSRGQKMGSAFLCADLGITPETREDHAAYLAHWLKVLKADSRAVFTAASQAQRATDFLHKLTRSEAPATTIAA
jgi:antirestriction protein ArdC